MTATQVHAVLEAKDPNYQVISVRESADYATGHIDGAINLVWSELAGQLNKLDPKKTTIVYCYTGNIGGEEAMLLNLMGYEAYNMMSGMSSWNADPAVGGFVGFNPANAFNFPVVR
jgi:rhodanese-related sulfurtransferase